MLSQLAKATKDGLFDDGHVGLFEDDLSVLHEINYAAYHVEPTRFLIESALCGKELFHSHFHIFYCLFGYGIGAILQ